MGMFTCIHTGYGSSPPGCRYRGTAAGTTFVAVTTVVGSLSLYAIAVLVSGPGERRRWPWAWSTAAALIIALVVLIVGSPWPEPPVTTTAAPTTTAPPSTTTVDPGTSAQVPTTVPPVTTARVPTTTTTTTAAALPPAELSTGLLCADVKAAGHDYREALAYWVREGRPSRMDADLDGIPCETVFEASAIENVLQFDADPSLAAGGFCRDVAGAGYGFGEALAYWVREGAPDRMDADSNELPCETVFPWEQILAVMAFDGSSFTPPVPRSSDWTIGAIVDRAQLWLDQRYAEHPDPPPGVLGASKITCEDRGRIVYLGDLFVCLLVPQTAPDFPLESAGVVFLVVSNNGDVASMSGTDMPSSTPQLLAMYEQARKGMLCRDLFDADVAHPFAASGLTGRDGYFVSLAYWFVEGMPSRMDADQNGKPCETLFDPADVNAVWSGLD
jgi:hypothetical protein